MSQWGTARVYTYNTHTKETERQEEIMLETERLRQVVMASDFEDALAARFKEAEELLVKKHRDYGPKNISHSPGGPLNGLRVRMHDKLARINHLYDNNASPENESLRDSFIDMANYAIIGLMVLDEVWEVEFPPLHP